MPSQARQAVIESLLSEKNKWFILSWDTNPPKRLMMYKSLKSAAAAKKMIPPTFNPTLAIHTSEQMREILEYDDLLVPCVEWDLKPKNQPVPVAWTP